MPLILQHFFQWWIKRNRQLAPGASHYEIKLFVILLSKKSETWNEQNTQLPITEFHSQYVLLGKFLMLLTWSPGEKYQHKRKSHFLIGNHVDGIQNSWTLVNVTYRSISISVIVSVSSMHTFGTSVLACFISILISGALLFYHMHIDDNDSLWFSISINFLFIFLDFNCHQILSDKQLQFISLYPIIFNY